MTLAAAAFDFPLDLGTEIAANVRAALIEDIGAGDLTAELVPAANHSIATVIVRDPAVVCGIDWFNRCFAEIDPAIRIHWQVSEGDHVGPDTLLCELRGASRALLSGERAALNFLQLLSGVATRTATFVAAVSGTRAQIVDTRKTIPGLGRDPDQGKPHPGGRWHHSSREGRPGCGITTYRPLSFCSG